jgi:hypothetical protein
MERRENVKQNGPNGDSRESKAQKHLLGAGTSPCKPVQANALLKTAYPHLSRRSALLMGPENEVVAPAPQGRRFNYYSSGSHHTVVLMGMQRIALTTYRA